MTIGRSGAFALALAVAGTAYPCVLDHGRRAAAAKATPARGKAVAPLWVGPAYSGTWYTTERSGEGFTLQILDTGAALAVWFTYPPAGSSAAQAWIMAQDGVIEGDRIRFASAYSTRGPRFGAQFDPAQVERIGWGTLEFRFLDCNRGEVRYAGPEGWGSGVREVVRLTAHAELECTGKKRLGTSGTRSLAGLRQRSGLWFDPSHNGEGWKVEELPDGRAQIFWFTYDEKGEQAWTIGVAPRSGERLEVTENFRPLGTRFGAGFNTADVRLQRWGRFTLAFDSCDKASLQYDSTLPAFGAGTLKPVRLTRLAGTSCVDGTPAVPSSGNWTLAPRAPVALSESATATLGGRSCLAGGFDHFKAFLCYEAASGNWTTLLDMPVGRDHPAAVAMGDELYLAGGYPNDAASGQEISGWRYRFSTGKWDAVPQLPYVAAAGAAMLDGYAYFGQLNGDIHQVDLRTLATRRIPGDGSALRDHAQLVAFQGELWFMGGRNTSWVDTSRVSIYDPASETWRPGPRMRTTRAGFAAAASPTLLLAAGGERISTPPYSVLGSVEGIAAGEDQWTMLADLPVAVHGVGGAIHGNAFHVLGGSRIPAGVGNEGTVQIYRWTP